MPVGAIVFDVSGTLLNDIYAVWKATADAYAALGMNGFRNLEEFKERFRLPLSEFHLANGIPHHCCMRWIRDSGRLTLNMPAL